MLLTITTTAPRASEIGYLLHKNPATVFCRDLTVGKVWIFYPEAADERTTCALLLEVDSIGLMRGGGRGPRSAAIESYVNDRPYVAGSMMAVAIAQCFGSALSGSAREMAERLDERWPFEVDIPAVSCRAGEKLIREFFEPLGYALRVTGYPLDERFVAWGESSIYSVTLLGRQTVRALLNHLYILLPALDAAKHYFVGEDEVDKLVRKGEEWLAGHPQRDLIVRRYLKHRGELARMAISRLTADEAEPETDPDDEEAKLERSVDSLTAATTLINGASPQAAIDGPVQSRDRQGEDFSRAPQLIAPTPTEAPVDDEEAKPRLHDLRLNTVLAVVRDPRRKIESVIDLGCGEGRFVRLLMKERQLKRIVGMDVSVPVLARATKRLRLHQHPLAQRDRVTLLHGSLCYRDERLAGFDAATLIEVIEHLDPARLGALERVVFEHARPGTVVVTTPNAEYNVVWDALPAGKLRHRDHRFEWTRAEFRGWCEVVAARFGYGYSMHDVGPVSPEHFDAGTPTQMAVFAMQGGYPELTAL